MKKLSAKLFSIAVAAGLLLLNSCFFKEPGSSIKFTDILIEIEQATRPGDANTKDTRQYEKIFDNRFTQDSLKINLVGPHQNEDIIVNFEIAPAGDVSGTTAVLGQHYRILNPNNQIVIPAGQSFGWLKFEVNDDILSTNSANFVAIRINLTSTSKGRLSENFKTHRIVIGGKCTFLLTKFTGNYLVDEPGYTPPPYPATLSISTSGPNRIQTNNFWDVGATVVYELNPATNGVSIIGTTYTDGSDTFNVTTDTSAPASDRQFDPCTGNFKIAYVVRLGGTVGSGPIIDQNVHTYNKQ